MSETTTDDRRSRLDEFADMAQQPNVPMVTIMPAAPARLDIPHGAIKVQEKRNRVTIAAELREMAAMLGQRGYYSWEVNNKKKGTKDVVEGVSIKGANALVRAYGNCHVSCPLVVDLGTHWRFHAVFVDFETGVELERSFIQRKNTGGGMGDNAERSVDMSYQVGVSKAERNVVLNVLDVEADFLLEECKKDLVRKIGNDPEHWRGRVVQRLAERAIDLQRVEAVVGRPIKDWLARDIARVIAGIRAIADGFALADDVFPPREADAAKVTAKLDEFASSPGNLAPGEETATGQDRRTPDPVATRSPADSVQPDDGGDRDRDSRPSSSGAADRPSTAAPDLRDDLIAVVIQLATASGDEQARLETLDAAWPAWQELVSAKFHKLAFSTAAKLAKGEIDESTARRYLDEVKGKK
jgi:hypothetical protein